MGTSRLETFADGVLAIAATLLILDVSVGGSPLSTQLARAWPSYVAYMVSFLTIGIIWVNHHAIMDQVARCDRTFLVVNVFFLMVVAFIPFPTRLVAQHLRGDGAEEAAIAYGVTLTLTAVFFNILWFYAARGGRLARRVLAQGVRRADRLAHLQAAAGVQDAHRAGPVVAAGVLVNSRRPPELAHRHHEHVVREAAVARSSTSAATPASNCGSSRRFSSVKLLPCVSHPPPACTVTNVTPASTSRRASKHD